MSLIGGGIGGGSLPGVPGGGGFTTNFPSSALPPGGSISPSSPEPSTIPFEVVQVLIKNHKSTNNYLRLRHLGYI